MVPCRGLPLSVVVALGYLVGLTFILMLNQGVVGQNCTGIDHRVGDGNCDDINNNDECVYDGGDCCECTCEDGPSIACGQNGFECRDPEAALPVNDCQNPPLISSPCSPSFSERVVTDAASASELAVAIRCSEGTFDVEWWGNVVLNQTIYVANGTTLRLTGADMEAGIDGGDHTRLFTVSGAFLQVSNMTISRGNAMFGGSVAASRSSLLFRHTSFTGATAEISGGAVYAVENSTIRWEGKTNLVSNKAGRDGGAVHVASNTSAIWEAQVYMINNTAGRDGGGLYVGHFSTASWDDQAHFIDNIAGQDGGAFCVEKFSTSCMKAVASLENNTAGQDDGTSSFSGGSTASWEDRTSFVNNTARERGGALSAKDNSACSWEAEAYFVSNAAGIDGGAISLEYNSTGKWKAEVFFIDNHAEVRGGALVLDDSSVSWEANASFVYNKAGGDGGAAALDSGSIANWEAGSSFVNNTAGDGGGAVLTWQMSTASWEAKASFVNNTSLDNGGAISLGDGSTALWKAEVSFVDNFAVWDGGALWLSDSSMAIWEAQAYYINNIADNDGGAVYLWNSHASWKVEAYYIRNTAKDGGGAVHIWFDSAASWEAEAFFIENSAAGGGALSVVRDSNFSCNAPARFSRNTAGKNGGAIQLIKRAKGVLEEGAEFHYNSASGNGGALFLYGRNNEPEPSVLIADGRLHFVGNHCGVSGGAMALMAVVSTIFGAYDIMFFGNSAGAAGGAVFIHGVGAGPHFIGVNFSSNVAEMGGAVHVLGSGTSVDEDKDGDLVKSPTIFERCKFIGNEARATGGAVNSGAGFDAFKDSRFVRNSAMAGGALRLAGTASLVNCTFVENMSAENEGAAVSNAGFLDAFAAVSFTDNSFECERGMFLDFAGPISSGGLLSAVCKGCEAKCEDCSTVPEALKCSEAMDHTSSPGGSTTLDTLLIDDGHWRASGDSRKVLACYNPGACGGGVTGAQSYCRRGYRGPYCSVCGEGFYHSMGYTCTECSGDTAGVFVALAAAVLLVVVSCLMVSTWLNHQGGAFQAKMNVWRRRLLSLKIVIIAWQILTQFATVANVTYPSTYQRFLDGIDVLNVDLGWMFQAGCVIDINFHHRLVLSTVGPLVILVIIGAAYGLARYRRPLSLDTSAAGNPLDQINQRYLFMALLLTFVVYSSVSSTLFQMFACDPLDDGNVYLRADYRITCDSSTHRTFQVYAGCMIVLYTGGIPLFYATLLFKHRRVLENPNFREDDPMARSAYSLWALYKPHRFWYELVECFRRVLLAGAVVFMYPNTIAQVAIAFMVSAFFMILSEVLAPYESVWDTWVSRLGHVIVFSSIYLALLLDIDLSTERTASQEVYEAILVAAHAAMVSIAILEAVVVSCNWFRRKQ